MGCVGTPAPLRRGGSPPGPRAPLTRSNPHISSIFQTSHCCSGTELVQKLAIPCSESDDTKAAIRRHLTPEAAGHWPLILDNADDTAVLDGLPIKSTSLLDFLPWSSARRILITTRSSRAGVDAAGSDMLQFTDMTPDEAEAFLGRSLLERGSLNS